MRISTAGDASPVGAGVDLTGLNPQQREAVGHFEGPLLVLAGAGSGKTRVLTSRVCHLIHEQGVPADAIFSVTFTNKAAGEMRERVVRMLGEEPRGMWTGTFHSLSARMLRRHAPVLGWPRNFTILDAEGSLRLIKTVQKQLDIDPKRWSPKAVRGQISTAKNALVSPQEFVDEYADSFDLFSRMVAKVYPVYQAALKDQASFDFDDLLVKPVQLFEANPHILEEYHRRFAFFLVDEYQDTNRAQFRLLELLASDRSNLMVVGDDDQSIYGWRGADISNILDFEKTFPGATVIRLEQNYRSTGTILDAANAVISRNVQRKGKTLHTEREVGEEITLVESADEVREARWIAKEIESRGGGAGTPYRSFAVLYRTNAQSRALEDALRLQGIPYQIVGGVRFYERREIQDVLGYLRLISNPRDAEAFARVVNYPKRGVGSVSVVRLVEWARERDLSGLEAAARADEVDGISTSATRNLQRFAELVQRFSVRAVSAGVGELLEELVGELSLIDELRREGSDGEDRAENVKELIAGALDFNASLVADWSEGELDTFTELDLFLQNVALVTDADRFDPDADTVTLMTLHNAKGLEYPVVFISGLEEGLFPLGRSYESPEALEEERRLFYVGVTRAEDKLYLSYARQRRRGGDFMYSTVSSFVESVPEDRLEVRKPERSRDRGGSFGRSSRSRGRGRDEEPEFGANLDSAPAGDFEMDQSLNQDLPRFTRGERVAHSTFGGGAVVEVTGFGRDLKVTVDFDSVGRKKLLARYAGLEKEWNG